MGTRRCMNAGCGATEAGGEWKKGWGLRSGGFANLCYKCGMAYEQLVFCDMFHLKESGWRECNICGKRLHCGCVASRCFVDLLDGGGVQCISCMKGPEHSFIPNIVVQEFLPQQSHTAVALSAQHVKDGIANEVGTAQCASELLPASADGMMDSDAGNKGQAKAIHLLKQIESNGQSSVLLSQRDCIDGSFGQIRLEQVASYIGEAGSIRLSNRTQGPLGSSYISLRNENENAMADNMVCESLGQACLSIGLGTSNPSNMMEATSGIGIPHTVLHLTGADIEGKDHSKVPSTSRQVQRACHFIPVPPKAGDAAAPEATKNVLSHMRVARPPGEGRGRNQLLPRYWPRITEQELQQISGDSNSTIVPLFEKVLSASDAGRIGRLVLPKACAEAYFPPISQPEGLPLTIQDAKGKDWHFQFRYWPNNNSRMYVLEGVTPCIQSLQLQAGDTVTFSRIDPEGKLVMGFRKATNSVPLQEHKKNLYGCYILKSIIEQDSQISAIANGALGNENFLLGASENLPVLSGYSICQSVKGTADPQSCSLSEHLNSADGIISCRRTDKHVGRANGGLSLPPLLLPDRRRSRNIGPKNKRLHMDNEDALELKLTWEEAQDLLRPPPSAKPSIVMIEDHEFEEYEEPPVFGKRTIFTARTSGGQDQWIQCDDCFKWRRLPVDVLVPSKWTCANNNCDPKRSSCSVPCELSSCELQDLLSQNADMKRRKITANLKQNSTEPEASGLEALAAAAALGDMGNQVTASAATTTRHPRHRPGCTCIVCIQPPSGKGPKHSPACTCNVCMTVKRRFRTLMMRKKQRQTELEEAEGQKKLPWGGKEEAETSSSLKNFQPLDPQRESDLVPSEMSKERIDLNFCPERDVESHMGLSSSRVSMMSLLKVASRPLEAYLQQNGLKSLALEQVVSSSSHTIPQATAESQGRTPDDSCVASVTREQESGADERCCKSDNVRNDAT